MCDEMGLSHRLMTYETDPYLEIQGQIKVWKYLGTYLPSIAQCRAHCTLIVQKLLFLLSTGLRASSTLLLHVLYSIVSSCVLYFLES